MNDFYLSPAFSSVYAILAKLLSVLITHKPVHDCPFPVYPVKLSTMLVQVALPSQLSVLVEH